jgi:glycosyltransferase involved in cell wall biosynthesis
VRRVDSVSFSKSEFAAGGAPNDVGRARKESIDLDLLELGESLPNGWRSRRSWRMRSRSPQIAFRGLRQAFCRVPFLCQNLLMPSVAVVISTRNRAATLRGTLHAVAAIAVPRDWSTELVVVDNGSVDDTPEVAARGRLGSAAAQVIVQPEAGVARSRNVGARATRGEVLVFLDDDIHPPSDWLAALVAPILDSRVSGTVSRFKAVGLEDKDWLTDAERGALVTETSINPDSPFLAAGSMAISRKTFDACGGFEDALGPGALGAGGEDLLLTYRLAERGEQIELVPVSVEHWIDPENITPEKLAARRVAEKRSEAWLAYHWFGRSAWPSVVKAPLLRVFRTLLNDSGWGERFAWHDQMRIEARHPRRFER